MKFCPQCQTLKSLTEFSVRVDTGLPRSNCKPCGVISAGRWAKNNRAACSEASRRYRVAHLEKSRGAARSAAAKKRAVISVAKALLPKRPLQTQEERNAKRRENRRQNPDIERKKDRDRYARRSREDPTYRIGLNLRSRVTIALRRAISRKSRTTFSLLGCPVVWLQVHLESLFVPGMTWENYGPVWHVDHIKPCAKFDLTDPEQQKICFHWTNLQPLFARDNYRKHDNYDGP